MLIALYARNYDPIRQNIEIDGINETKSVFVNIEANERVKWYKLTIGYAQVI